MKKENGLTLIELLISLAMISAVSIALFYFSFSSIKLIGRTIDNGKSTQIVRFIAGRISSDIMQSSGAGPNSGANKLILGNISYEWDGKVRRQEGGDIYYLTTEKEIKGLEFSYPSSKLVKLEITPNIGGTYSVSVYARN